MGSALLGLHLTLVILKVIVKVTQTSKAYIHNIASDFHIVLTQGKRNKMYLLVYLRDLRFTITSFGEYTHL